MALHFLWKNDNIIFCIVNSCTDNSGCKLFACYDPSFYGGKCIFWEALTYLTDEEQFPWLIFSDLNEIVDQSEKLGGREIHMKRLFVKDFLKDTGG